MISNVDVIEAALDNEIELQQVLTWTDKNYKKRTREIHPLQRAIRSQKTKCAQLLTTNENIEHEGQFGWNAIDEAAHVGNLELLEYFLKDSRHFSIPLYAFHLAVSNDHVHIVTWCLITKKWSTEKYHSNSGYTAIGFAVHASAFHVVEWLSSNRPQCIAVKQGPNRDRPLLTLAHDKKIAQLLISAKANLREAFLYAVTHDVKLSIVRLLVKLAEEGNIVYPFDTEQPMFPVFQRMLRNANDHNWINIQYEFLGTITHIQDARFSWPHLISYCLDQTPSHEECNLIPPFAQIVIIQHILDKWLSPKFPRVIYRFILELLNFCDHTLVLE